jgi:hypothetical protein
MDLQAQALHAAGILVLDGYQPLLPAPRQRGGILAHALGVVAELLMKVRAFTDGAIDEVGPLRAVARVEVGFHGRAQRDRCIRERPQHGLTADDDDLVVVGNGAGRANQVLKLGTRHRCACAPRC